MGAHQAPAAVFFFRLPHPLSGRWTDGPLAGAPVLTALHRGFPDKGLAHRRYGWLLPAAGRSAGGRGFAAATRDTGVRIRPGRAFLHPPRRTPNGMQPRAPLPAPTTRRLELRPLVRARMAGSVRQQGRIVKENNPNYILDKAGWMARIRLKESSHVPASYFHRRRQSPPIP
jgi:hypothetical protein